MRYRQAQGSGSYAIGFPGNGDAAARTPRVAILYQCPGRGRAGHVDDSRHARVIQIRRRRAGVAPAGRRAARQERRTTPRSADARYYPYFTVGLVFVRAIENGEVAIRFHTDGGLAGE